jgi:hypothetical protein
VSNLGHARRPKGTGLLRFARNDKGRRGFDRAFLFWANSVIVAGVRPFGILS